jgi:hypothetical protein
VLIVGVLVALVFGRATAAKSPLVVTRLGQTNSNIISLEVRNRSTREVFLEPVVTFEWHDVEHDDEKAYGFKLSGVGDVQFPPGGTMEFQYVVPNGSPWKINVHYTTRFHRSYVNTWARVEKALHDTLRITLPQRYRPLPYVEVQRYGVAPLVGPATNNPAHTVLGP